MSYCRACRPIKKEDFDNPNLHFGTCQECGRTNRRDIMTVFQRKSR
ncbi:hypothetical protein KAW50_07850 [candidate division WOR-3 bacterium]|nr:hypothetical protein [candidate division WOR-3 bacterium]